MAEDYELIALSVTGDKRAGSFAIIDAEDYRFVRRYRWSIDNYGYAFRHVYEAGQSETVKLHRFIMDAAPGITVQFIDKNRLNCRKSNLRFCTRSQVLQYNGARADNKTGRKGVTKHRDTGRFRATIKINGKQTHLGIFSTVEEAAAAYNAAAEKHFGEFANR